MALNKEQVLACLDARMREVYVAGYRRRDDAWEPVLPAAVLAPLAVEAPTMCSFPSVSTPPR